jgi:hypothetical protein
MPFFVAFVLFVVKKMIPPQLVSAFTDEWPGKGDEDANH